MWERADHGKCCECDSGLTYPEAATLRGFCVQCAGSRVGEGAKDAGPLRLALWFVGWSRDRTLDDLHSFQPNWEN
jgi:hypothetical protein